MKLKFSKGKPFDVVGIGRNSWDRIVVVEEYPAPDTKIEALEVKHQSGGQVATTLVAATRLGAKTRYLGKFGDDAAGRAVRGALVREGIDLMASKVLHQVPNQISFIVVDSTQHTRNVFGFADPRLRSNMDDFKKDSIISGKILFLGGRFPTDAIPFARIAKDEGSIIVVDADTPGDGLAELFTFCDVVISPEPFVKKFTEESDLKIGLKKIASMGPRIVCCTQGSQGAAGYFEDHFYHAKSPKVKVVDTTGAGDVFQGAFLVGFLEQMPPERLLRFSCAAAAMKCTQVGGQAGIPTRKSLNAFLKKI